jgi:hypothetical protein
MNFPTGVAADTTSRGVEAETGIEGTEGKPTPDELGIDLARLVWQRSGEGDGSIEIAFPLGAAWTRGDWVLMRVAGDRNGRVLVFDRNEWACFLDGARNGEFNDATNRGESDS